MRMQAQALRIEARAKERLADEYDAAQERGEVATGNRARDFGVAGDNAKPATAADLGLRRDEIHEVRRLRDAERAEPFFQCRRMRLRRHLALRSALLPASKPKAGSRTLEQSQRSARRWNRPVSSSSNRTAAGRGVRLRKG